MSVKLALLSLATLIPGLLCAQQLEISTEDVFVEANEVGHVYWRPTSGGKSRFVYLLPQDGIREAIEYYDTTSLFYLSQVSERPIEGQVYTAPNGTLELAQDAKRIAASWFVTPTISLGLGATQKEDATNLFLHGAIILAPSSTQLTTLAVDVFGENRLQFDRATLHINETSESLLYAAVSDYGGQAFSLSYGQRFWDVFSGVDVAWAAGVDRDKQFASLQFEKGFESMRGALDVTLRPNEALKVGLSMQIGLGAHFRYGDWSGRFTSTAKQETALEIPSLYKLRRDYMATLWRRDVSVEALRHAQK